MGFGTGFMTQAVAHAGPLTAQVVGRGWNRQAWANFRHLKRQGVALSEKLIRNLQTGKHYDQCLRNLFLRNDLTQINFQGREKDDIKRQLDVLLRQCEGYGASGIDYDFSVFVITQNEYPELWQKGIRVVLGIASTMIDL